MSDQTRSKRLTARKSGDPGTPPQHSQGVFGELRRQVDELAARELRHTERQLASLSQEEREAVVTLTNRLSDAILQRFVARLRIASEAGDRRLIEAAQFLFGSDANQAKEPVLIEPLHLAHLTVTREDRR
jgi:hypothetical protein